MSSSEVQYLGALTEFVRVQTVDLGNVVDMKALGQSGGYK